MPLSAAERAKRRIEKLKADGKYEAFKVQRNVIAKRSRDKLKDEMGDLPSRMYSRKIEEVRQKARDRVRKYRQNKKNSDISTKTSLGKSKSNCETQASNLVDKSLNQNKVPGKIQVEETSKESILVRIALNADLIKLVQKAKSVQCHKRSSNRIPIKKQLQSMNKTDGLTDLTPNETVLTPDEIVLTPDETVSRHDEHGSTKTCEITDPNIARIETSEELPDVTAFNTVQSSSADSVNVPQRKLPRKRNDNAGEINETQPCRILQDKTTVIQKIFKTDCALRKAVSRSSQALPKCPRKRKVVVIKLYEKFVGSSMTKKIVRPRSSRLNKQIEESVIKFYERDDISRQAPGLKVINVKDAAGNKTKVQIKYLMYPIRVVYRKYCAEMKSSPLKSSKFFSLRPKHVISVTKIPHTVCLCPYHENFIYAIISLRKIFPEVPQYGDIDDNFYKTFFCENMSKNCWYNECDECKDVLHDTLLGIAENVPESSTKISWQVWKEFDWIKDGKVMGKRWQKVSESGTIIDLVKHILDIAPHFIQHAFVKREQSKRYQEDIKSMDSSVATIQVDFAENPVCVYQKQIQRAHYNQNQLTMFTAASWICQKIQSHSIVSDNLDHTKTAIVPYLDRLLEELPDTIKTVKIWSDGPTKQFKNRFIAASLAPLEKKYNVKIEWNFFATSHGKGPEDGIGGALKRQVREKVLSGEVEVRNAAEFVSAVDENSKVNVILMKEEEAIERVASLNLLELWKKAPNVNGIFKFHQLSVIDGKVTGKLISQTI